MATVTITGERQYRGHYWRPVIGDHKRNRNNSGSGQEKGNHDFMDLLLNLVEEGQEFDGRDGDTTIKATCLVSGNSLFLSISFKLYPNKKLNFIYFMFFFFLSFLYLYGVDILYS